MPNITPSENPKAIGRGAPLRLMKRSTSDLPCLFTGHLAGEDLLAAYASSDLFFFPSTTDTVGNVVLEARASGLPVILSAAPKWGGRPRLHGERIVLNRLQRNLEDVWQRERA